MPSIKSSIVRFPYSLWLILLGTFLTSATYWMTWPFLAVILHQQNHLSPSLIGTLLSISVLVSTLTGIYFGHFADKFGRNHVMILGCLLAVIAFTLLAYATKTSTYVVAIALVGFSRALLDPISKAIFGDLLEKSDDRAMALQLRYFIVNLGAGIGPLIAMTIGIAAKQMTFLVTGLSFLLYLLLLCPEMLKIHSHKIKVLKKEKSTLSFNETLKVILSDRLFLILVLVNILLWIVFVQFESSIALYFAIVSLPGLVKLVSILIFTNTLVIVVLQFPLLKIMKNMAVSSRIYIGFGILALSQLMFAFSPLQSAFIWILSTIIFSIAEVILVPNLNIQIDQMAPSHLRGSYFAVSSLYRIGFGAYIGGVLLQFIGGVGLFMSMFLLCIGMISLYHFSNRHLDKN